MSLIKSTLLSFFHPKAILFGISVFIFGYIYVTELRGNFAFGCYDCGFLTRQAFLVLVASAALLVKRNWSVIISLLCSLKVLYTIGYVTFWNRAIIGGDSISQLNCWTVLKESIALSYETNSILFVELFITSIIIAYAILFLCESFSQKFLRK
jgi:hypothetical protein